MTTNGYSERALARRQVRREAVRRNGPTMPRLSPEAREANRRMLAVMAGGVA